LGFGLGRGDGLLVTGFGVGVGAALGGGMGAETGAAACGLLPHAASTSALALSMITAGTRTRTGYGGD
jgi:hypothetical protein